MHALQTAANHISNIQRQITALENWAANRPLTDAQKNTVAQRKKIYTDLLADAVLVYEAVQALQKEANILRDGIKLQKQIQLLNDSRPTQAGFLKWQAEYRAQHGRIKIMDFNKHQTI